MKNVLVVEDEEDVLNIFSEQLKLWGYNPVIASSGAEGLNKFNEMPIDLVISDIKMPGMDGITLLHKILQKDKDAIVILVTGYPSIDTAVQSMKDGAFDYLTKPLHIGELKIRIERALEKKRLQKSLALWKGVNWSLIISVPLWLILGIILARLL